MTLPWECRYITHLPTVEEACTHGVLAFLTPAERHQTYGNRHSSTRAQLIIRLYDEAERLEHKHPVIRLALQKMPARTDKPRRSSRR